MANACKVVAKQVMQDGVSGFFNRPCCQCTRFVIVLQVQKTVETVLDDMKAKFDAARDQFGGAQASATEAFSNLKMIKQGQERKLEEVKQLCRFVRFTH